MEKQVEGHLACMSSVWLENLLLMLGHNAYRMKISPRVNNKRIKNSILKVNSNQKSSKVIEDSISSRSWMSQVLQEKTQG